MPRGMRIKVAYGYYNKGDIIYPPGTTRDVLLQQGYIEEIPAVEDQDDEEIEEPAEPVIKRGRGRPRKVTAV